LRGGVAPSRAITRLHSIGSLPVGVLALNTPGNGLPGVASTLVAAVW
jgi:hypothetical protein